MANVAVSVILKTSLEFIAFLADVVAEPLPKVRARNETTDDIQGKAGIKTVRIETALINPSLIQPVLTFDRSRHLNSSARALRFLSFPKEFLKLCSALIYGSHTP
jgi:hypothetical protein